MVKHFLYLIVLATLLSCGKKEIKNELKNAYQISAESENDTLKINQFKILRKTNVDFDFAQKIKINNLNNMIDNSQLLINLTREKIELLNKSIENRKYFIELNNENKAQYQAELEYDQNKLKKSKISIKEIENRITILHQEIVLIKAELSENKEKNFELIDYIFKGEINGKQRVDTMSILFSPKHKFYYIKNNTYTNYKGK